MRILFFFVPVLLVPVYSKTHLCSQCIEEGAKAVEREWHGASYMRLLYNDKWPSCEYSTNATSEVGCFEVKMSKGLVPKGKYYLMQGPMSSLLTVNGYDLRQRHLSGQQTMEFDGTKFEFTYCQAEKCFMDMPARSKAKPLPETLLRGQRVAAPNEMTTISSVSEQKAALVVAATPASSLADDLGFAALLSPWVVLYMVLLSFVCGLLAFFAGFGVAYYCELGWEKRLCTTMKFNHYELAPTVSVIAATPTTTAREVTESSFSNNSNLSSCCSSFTG